MTDSTSCRRCKPATDTEAKRERLWSAIEQARLDADRGDPTAELRLVTAWNALAAFNLDNG
jgi:hypothetical protein